MLESGVKGGWKGMFCFQVMNIGSPKEPTFRLFFFFFMPSFTMCACSGLGCRYFQEDQSGLSQAFSLGKSLASSGV